MGLFICIIGIVIGFIIIGSGFSSRKKTKNIYASESIDISSLNELISDSEVATFASNKLIDIEGIINPAPFYKSEFSQTPCVFSHVEVLERYEETYYVQNPNRKNSRLRQTRTGNKSIKNEIHWIEFSIIDSNKNIIYVYPKDAEIELFTTYDNYEPYGKPSGKDYRILGYTKKELIMPTQKKIFVMGELFYENNKFIIKKPTSIGMNFIISPRKKSELIASSTANEKVGFILGAILLLGSLIALIAILTTHNL